MNFWQARLGCILIALWLSGCAVAPALSPEQRPRDWAQQVGSVPLRTDARLPNLYQVSPVLYRSAQPGVEGLDILNRQLARNHGLPTEIKTVISLRNNAGDHVDLRLQNIAAVTLAGLEGDDFASQYATLYRAFQAKAQGWRVGIRPE